MVDSDLRPLGDDPWWGDRHDCGVTAPSIVDADLCFLDSMSPEYQADWHGLNREALAHGPIALGPFGPALLGYGAVQTALRDRRFRMPNIRRAGPAPCKPTVSISGPITMPVTFDPGH